MKKSQPKTIKRNDEATTIGRPKGSGKYTPELGDKIIELIAEGKSLRDIAAEPGMPPRQTISAWGRNEELSDPDFPGRYAHARDAGTHAQFEQLRDLEKRLLAKDSDLNPHSARVAIDTIKWRLSKMMPAVYGERSHLEVTGGLKALTPKDLAPQWMRDEFAAEAKAKAIEAVPVLPAMAEMMGEN